MCDNLSRLCPATMLVVSWTRLHLLCSEQCKGIPGVFFAIAVGRSLLQREIRAVAMRSASIQGGSSILWKHDVANS